ncbi:MAG: hypothetical protein J1F60_10025 [Oscillospiraceae bacterium]|nr:hypothetical protein [Oscillospiraceae bacterium]
MKKVYIMIAAVTFVVGFVLGAVLILAKVTKSLETYCDDDSDVEELYRIDGASNGFVGKIKHAFSKEEV